MKDFQERVIKEREELGVKLHALSKFIDGGSEIYITLPLQEKSRLAMQRTAMLQYFEVLGQRIDAFEE